MKAIIQGTVPSLWSSIEGSKTYIAIFAFVGYPFLCRVLSVPVDEDVRTLLFGMIFAAFRSGNKTDSAKVVNAVVNPTSAAAQETAAQVAEPPSADNIGRDGLTDKERATYVALVNKIK